MNICLATCWFCKFDYCPPGGKPHSWAGAEEIEAAQEAGEPAPSGLCTCPCVGGGE